MGIADRLRQWKTLRRRRHSLGQPGSETRVVEIERRPPEDTALHPQSSTLRLPMDSVIGPRALARGRCHDGHPRPIRDLVAPQPARRSGACGFEPETKNLAQPARHPRPLTAARVQPCAGSGHTRQATRQADEDHAGDCSLQPLPPVVQRAGTRDETVQLISGTQAGALIQAAREPDDRLVSKSDTQGHDLKARPSQWPSAASAATASSTGCCTAPRCPLRRLMALNSNA